jgi:hypothetical protein
MSAVTVDVLTHTAHDAGLEGGTLQPLVNGACSFSSLTFKTTSYNLKGKPALRTRTWLGLGLGFGFGGLTLTLTLLTRPPHLRPQPSP